MTTVALQEVTKIFPGGTVAVDRLNLGVTDGEFLVLLGPSGCGKSTVLRIIAGLEEPTSGTVLVDGRPVDDLSPSERRVAMVFQDYAIYPHMTVGDNIGFPLKLAGQPAPTRAVRVAEVASALGIGDLLARRPHRLSGGQRQRVAMGRALVREPRLFLMDEPLSNLDSGLRSELRAEISSLARGLGVSTVYVTHDQTEALTMADRVAILRRGVLQDVGTPTEVYNRPATLYVAAFLGSPRMNLLEATVYASLDRHVAIAFGEQALYLPWDDLRSRVVAHYHGERIAVGMRPEALIPVPAGDPGQALVGRVRHLEHHGHETLAYVDVGAAAVPLDELVGSPPPAPSGWGSGARGAFDRLTGWLRRPAVARSAPTGSIAGRAGPVAGRAGPVAGRGGPAPNDGGAGRNHGGAGRYPAGPAADGSVLSEPGRHRRRPAEVAVRLAPYPRIAPGEPLPLSVRQEALHFFDDRGARIDVGPPP